MFKLNHLFSHAFGKIAQSFDYKQFSLPPTHLFGSIYLALVAITLVTPRIKAQVIIGGDENDDPAAGSVLSLNSTMKGGLQFSNVELTNLNEIPTGFPGITLENQHDNQLKKDFEGAVVYNTNCNFGSGKGVYMWDGEKWNYIGGGPDIPTGRVAYRNSTSGAIDGWMEFMSYNLGATPMSIDEQKAYPNVPLQTSYTEATATNFKTLFGDMYQWGRNTDGHEKVWSATSNIRVPVENFDNAGDKFVTTTSSPNDWLVNITNSIGNKPGRWGSENPDSNPLITAPNYKGVNDPCPCGFRVPSISDWRSILIGANSTSNNNDIGSLYDNVNRWEWGNGPNGGWLIYPPIVNANKEIIGYENTPTLFLPAGAKYRNYNGTFATGTSDYTVYWISTRYGNNNLYSNYMYALRIRRDNYRVDYATTYYRAHGAIVRCVSESRIPAD